MAKLYIAGELKQNSNIEIDDSDIVEESNVVKLNKEIPIVADSLLED